MTTPMSVDVVVPVVHGQGFNEVWSYPATYVVLAVAFAVAVTGMVITARADDFDQDVGGGLMVCAGALIALVMLLAPMAVSALDASSAQSEQAKAAFQSGYDLTLVNDPDPGFFGSPRPSLPRAEATSTEVHAVKDGVLLECLVTVVDSRYVPACTSGGAPVDIGGDR